jgi:hypothetical protein
MQDCNTLTAKVGRSSTDLTTLGTPVAVIGTYNCSLVRTDTGRYKYYEAYNYDLDTKSFVYNCSDSSCVAPPAYSQYSLVYNNGDFEGSACPGNAHNHPPYNYYTAQQGLANGTVLYSDQTLQSIAADGYYSNGIYNWYVSSGVMGDQQPC